MQPRIAVNKMNIYNIYMLSKLYEKFEVINRNHVLNRETNIVTKSGKRYRDVIGGAARPRKDIPNNDVVDALEILEKNPGKLKMVRFNMRNNQEVVLAAV